LITIKIKSIYIRVEIIHIVIQIRLYINFTRDLNIIFSLYLKYSIIISYILIFKVIPSNTPLYNGVFDPRKRRSGPSLSQCWFPHSVCKVELQVTGEFAAFVPAFVAVSCKTVDGFTSFVSCCLYFKQHSKAIFLLVLFGCLLFWLLWQSKYCFVLSFYLCSFIVWQLFGWRHHHPLPFWGSW